MVVGFYDVSAQVQSVTDTSGNVYTLAAGPTRGSAVPGTLAIYYAKNIAAAGPYNVVSVTFTSTQTREIAIAEYSGLDKVNPLDVVAANQGNSGTSTCGPEARRPPAG